MKGITYRVGLGLKVQVRYDFEEGRVMTPLAHYNQDLLRPEFVEDEAQKKAVILLDDLYKRLLKTQALNQQKESVAHCFFWQPWRDKSWFGKRYFDKFFFDKKSIKSAPEKGIYFWGGVGRGKTYVMDLFYHSLPFENKSRMHFHRFMHRVHGELKRLDGHENPLLLVAEMLAKESCVLCFDEFFVSDITDAMILATLFDALFAKGVCLVATSNVEPCHLYLNGLQRARFLPMIGLIEKHCAVVNLDAGVDYRARVLSQANIYYHPLNQEAEKALTGYFEQLVPHSNSPKTPLAIVINQRELWVKNEGNGVIYFDFSVLCESARSQIDYIELARLYHTVLVSNVKKMGESNEDTARRFIAMVDEFYERRVKLIISAEVALLSLYQDGRLSFEFKRCYSRLQEMQSLEYIGSVHLV